MTVRCPPRRTLRKALEVAVARDCRVQVNPAGMVFLITRDGTLLGQTAINQLSRAIEIEREEREEREQQAGTAA
jgi:hypothetical protein